MNQAAMNPMTLQAVLWVLGIAVTVLIGVIGFIVNWNRGQDQRMGQIEQKMASNAHHTAENYVRGHEIAQVKSEIAQLRQDMTKAVGDLRQEMTHQVGELTKAVYQMMGQNNSK